MAIVRIPNQPYPFYTDSETKFNERDSKCFWHLDYFQKVDCSDIWMWQFDSTELNGTENQRDGGFDFSVTGTTDGVNTNELIDSGVDFTALNVVEGMYANNTTDGTSAQITNVTATILTLDENIFISGEDYTISHYSWTGGDVTITGGEIDIQATGEVVVTQDSLKINSYQKITFDITSFYMPVGTEIRIYIGDADATSLAYTISPDNIRTGTFTIYGKTVDSKSSNELIIKIDDGVNITMDNLRIVQMSTSVYSINNCDDNAGIYLGNVSNTNIFYSNTSSKIMHYLDWSNVDCNNCYYVSVYNNVIPDNISSTRITDGTFSFPNFWNLGSNWAISGGKAVVNGSSSGNLTQTALAKNFSNNIAYNVVFTISDYVNGDITVKLYSGGVEIDDLGTVSGNGVKTLETSQLSAECDEIRFIPNSGTCNLKIDDVSATINTTNTIPDYTGDCIELGTWDCTVQLSGICNDNAFNFDFEGLSFLPSIRVEGQLRTPSYDDDSELEEDSVGTNTMVYFNSDKKYTLHLYDLPEYIHDFVRILKGFDIFYVDSSQYFPVDSGYEPEWVNEKNKIFDLSKVNFDIKQKTELSKNRYC